MAVKIRLQRRGRKKLAIFDIVVADSRSPRDGKIIEKIHKKKKADEFRGLDAAAGEIGFN